MRVLKIKFYFMCLTLFIILMFNSSTFYEYLFEIKSKYNKNKNCEDFKFNHVVVHLDFKGSPPKMGYLLSLLRDFKVWGVTDLLMEYEDMFPFDNDLAFLKAENAYSRKELEKFLHIAKMNKIEIIPLIQTFGHLEYVLKYETHSSLREEPAFNDSICPSKNESLTLIQKLLTQIIDFHNIIKPLNIIHIGCDEVYHLNKCNDCIKRNVSSWDLFSRHVIKIASFIRTKYNIQPLIWDDMMREIDPKTLKKSTIQDYIEPVVWAYQENVLDSIKHKTWYVYSQVFKKIWIASAFKGADGKTNMIPKITKRYYNHLSWMKFVTHYRKQILQKSFKVEGIFLTGWSRYNHAQPLCEILPMSMPSLLMNLILIESYCKLQDEKVDQYVTNVWLNHSKCHGKIITDNPVLSVKNAVNITHSCVFPHSGLFEVYLNTIEMDNVLLRHLQNDDLSIGDLQLARALSFSNIAEKRLINSLLKYYDLKTAVEIFQGRQSSLRKLLEKISKSKLQLMHEEILSLAVY